VCPMQVADATPLVLSPQTFRRYAFANVFALWVIVTTGATVRLTASGLGCEHWPGCTASNPFPEKDYHSFIEFGNRVVSAATIAITLLVWVGSLITPYLPRWARWLAGATFFGTLAQAPLGALTVYAGLNPLLVMTHFLLALAVLAAGVVVAVEAVRLELGPAREPLPRPARTGALVMVAACLALVVTGTIATAAGPHPGSADVSRLWHLHAAVYVHVRATAVFGVTFLVLAVYLWRRRDRWPVLVEGTAIVLGILILQMAIGELQYRTHLPWGLVLVHVSIASALWASVVALASLLRRPIATVSP
jgi:heme a synthase